jgi:hypothetical protein
MKQADQEELLEEEEQRRQQVLQQLQGPDTQLESGLKVTNGHHRRQPQAGAAAAKECVA